MNEIQVAAPQAVESALSFSGLKDLGVSPLHFWARHVDPERVRPEPTAAQRVGTALHCAVFEPDAFGARYARAFDASVYPDALDTVQDIRKAVEDLGFTAKGTKKVDVIANAKAAFSTAGVDRQFLAELIEAHTERIGDRVVLSVAEWESVERMAEALRRDACVRDLLSAGLPEQRFSNKLNGTPIRGIVDWAAPDFNLDLKTFWVRGNKAFDRAVIDTIYYERYHVQAAFYRHLRTSATGPMQFHHYCVFVENEAPWEVRAIRLSRCERGGRVMNLYWHSAEMEIARAADTFQQCVSRFGFGTEPWRNDSAVRDLVDEDIKQLSWEVFEQ